MNESESQRNSNSAAPLPRRRHSGWPLAYFITFPTYGTWLHGDERGSVDRHHNKPGTPRLGSDHWRNELEHRARRGPAVTRSQEARAVVKRTIDDVARHNRLLLHAEAVQSNHVHIVISAHLPPERAMNSIKSWSTRRLVEAGLRSPNTRTWVRHGSTRYLWKPESLYRACVYVLECQD